MDTVTAREVLRAVKETGIQREENCGYVIIENKRPENIIPEDQLDTVDRDVGIMVFINYDDFYPPYFICQKDDDFMVFINYGSVECILSTSPEKDRVFDVVSRCIAEPAPPVTIEVSGLFYSIKEKLNGISQIIHKFESLYQQQVNYYKGVTRTIPKSGNNQIVYQITANNVNELIKYTDTENGIKLDFSEMKGEGYLWHFEVSSKQTMMGADWIEYTVAKSPEMGFRAQRNWIQDKKWSDITGIQMNSRDVARAWRRLRVPPCFAESAEGLINSVFEQTQQDLDRTHTELAGILKRMLMLQERVNRSGHVRGHLAL